MKVSYSLWASDARVLLQPEDALEGYMFTVRPGPKADNVYYAEHGYVWLSDHEVEVVRPRLEERIGEITAAVEEKIQKTRAEAEQEVKKLREQLANILALTHERGEEE